MNTNDDPGNFVIPNFKKLEGQSKMSLLDFFGAPTAFEEIFRRMEVLLEVQCISTLERCAIVDSRKDLNRLLEKSEGRLEDVIMSDPLADPVIRPTVDEAIASDDTADALGAFLRTSEWISKLEHRYVLGLEHRHLPGEDI